VIEMRYLGQNYGIDIPVPYVLGRPLGEEDLQAILQSFHRSHEGLYGYTIPDEVIEFVNFKATAVGHIPPPSIGKRQPGAAARPKQIRRVYLKEVKGWADCPIFDRESLPVGFQMQGPSVIEEAMSTTLLLPGQTLRVDDYGNLLVRTSVA